MPGPNPSIPFSVIELLPTYDLDTLKFIAEQINSEKKLYTLYEFKLWKHAFQMCFQQFSAQVSSADRR
jgi:hypothetical protein